MKVGIIVPDRGDRPQFMQHCNWLISQQTFKPICSALIDYVPESNEKDISQRYRRGYEKLRGRDLDCILLIESDDWYAPTYIETMVNAWQLAGKPDIFGTNYTVYYSLRLWAGFIMRHTERSSAMSTLIKPDMDFDWPPDHEPYTDTHLWMVSHHTNTNTRLTQAVFKPDPIICLGIKHGIGLTGGNGHTTHMHRYINTDPDKAWLKSVVDPTSFEFYSHVLNKC